MKNRDVGIQILLYFVTFGFYLLYWHVSTKKEMVKLGANIPTAWLIIIPYVNIYFFYKWFKGAEQIVKINGLKLFLIYTVLPYAISVVSALLFLIYSEAILTYLSESAAEPSSVGDPPSAITWLNLSSWITSPLCLAAVLVVMYHIQTKFNSLGEAPGNFANPPIDQKTV